VIRLVAALVLGLLLAWALRRWRLGVRAVLYLLVLEGAIRKWLLPGDQQLVYLAKDLLLLAVYAGFLVSARRMPRARLSPMVVLPLAACALWGAVEIFNPKLPSVLVGVFGWKAYFLYVPLLWVVPAAFRDMADLERFARRFVYLLIPQAILGFLQFRSAASSVLNRYAWGEAAASGVATFGEAGSPVRVTGTFSYISGYVSFLALAGLLALALLAARRFRWKENLLLWASLAAVPFGILFSGSRAPAILLGGIAPVFVLLASGRGGRRFDTLARFALGVGLMAALVSYTGAPALEAFIQRTRAASDVGGRFSTPFVEPLRLAADVGVFAYGIGATHQAAASLVPGLRPGSWLDGLEAEAESSRVMIELGPIGFALHYGSRVALTIAVFAWARGRRTPFGRSIALAAAFFLLAQLPGAIVVNVTNSLLFWFLAGCAHLTVTAEERSVRARAETSAAPFRAPGAASSIGASAR
jgi:hypothetical protein